MRPYVSRFSQWLGKSNQRAKGKSRLSGNFTYQGLEARRLLAGIFYNAGTGIVTIEGSSSDDSSIVTMSSATDIRVTLTGFAAQSFTASTVSKLFFDGLAGNDFFRNVTNIISEANGGLGNDRLLGGTNDDLLVGGAGNDRLVGGDGNDVLIGNEDDDRLLGGTGDDSLVGSEGIDSLDGEDGNDTLLGGEDADSLFGGLGNDVLRGLAGNDFILGQDGDDNADGGEGNDFINGGDGVDDLIGGDGDDILRGGADSDRLEGGVGNDRLIGEVGDDFMIGGLGNDFLSGEGGNDFLDGNEGDDSVFGGGGDDQIFGSDGNDSLVGGAGADTIFGGFGSDIIAGDDGDDRLDGGLDSDTIFGNAGNDALFGSFAADFLFGGDGDDFLDGSFGIDAIYGNDGNDELHGGDDNDLLFGGNGNDRLFGEVGIDTLRGFAGNDALFGGVGETDILIGGDGKDRFLNFGAEQIVDLQAVDAKIEFRNATSTWTNVEIKVIDDGLDLMQNRTNNTRLLKGTLTSEPLVFIKEFTLPVNGRLGDNQFATITSQVFNPVTGNIDTIVIMEHQIRFGDWDETNQSLNDLHFVEVTREIAHNWASTAKITAALPSQAGLFNSFSNISGWTQTRPPDNVIQFYDISLDNQWFFFQSALFTETYAKTNPVEDFSAVWKFYFDPFISSTDKLPFIVKTERLDQLFSFLEAF